MKRIHIVGSGPRTGTTLLAEVMATCFDIGRFCEHEESLFTQQPNEYGVFLTKKPGEFMSVKWPLFFDKKLYVICLVRDPRDTIVSIHGSRPNEYWASLKFWKKFIGVYNKLKTNKRFIVVRYEDFVTDPDGIQQYIVRKIPFLHNKYKFSEYHKIASPSEKSLKAMRKLRPIEPIGIGNWKNHLPRVKQQILIHGDISDSLIKFSYEQDMRWKKRLEEIPIVKYHTVTNESFKLDKQVKKKQVEILYVVSLICEKVGIGRNFIYNVKKKYLSRAK